MVVSGANSLNSIAFCASARSGLGHLRRVATIATALKQLAPEAHLSLITNASAVGLSSDDQAQFSRIVTSERTNMARAAVAIGAEAVVIDTAVVPDAELLPMPLILILRETVPSRLASFKLPGGRLWDEIIVPAPRGTWTPDRSLVGSRSVSNVGWIYRTARPAGGVLPIAEGSRTLLIATGGGGNDETAAAVTRELEPIVAMVRSRLPRNLRVLQACGPRAPVGSVLASVDAAVDVGSRLDEAFAEADLVISTAGYNSVLELATTDTPAMLVSIARTFDDQTARAREWGKQLGLDHDVSNPARSAAWITDILMTGRRRAVVDLGPSGCAMAARQIAGVLETAPQAPTSQQYFFKQPAAEAPTSRVTAVRSRVLFDRGIATCPATPVPGRDILAFAHATGPTAFQLWADTPDTNPARPIARELCEAVLKPLASLHDAGPQGLSLSRFDPMRRITPRLRRTSSNRLRLATALADALLTAANRLESKEVVVHGDFHLRQLIQPTSRNDFILVDLDDLALGPAEVDIGNCIAHLATSRSANSAQSHMRFAELMNCFDAGYANVSGRRLDENAVRIFGALALVRRALKLSESGADEEATVGIVASAAKVAGKSLHVPDCGRQDWMAEIDDGGRTVQS